MDTVFKCSGRAVTADPGLDTDSTLAPEVLALALVPGTAERLEELLGGGAGPAFVFARPGAAKRKAKEEEEEEAEDEEGDDDPGQSSHRGAREELSDALLCDASVGKPAGGLTGSDGPPAVAASAGESLGGSPPASSMP